VTRDLSTHKEGDLASPSQSLKSNALGAFGAAALGSVMMAPALAIYANLGPISGAAGNIAPAVFLGALLCILPTAVSFALIAREIPSAGSAYTWLSTAVNRGIGTWLGLILLAMFLFCIILQPILFGLFFNELLASVFHVPVGYWTS
jgi:putrescine importer